MENLLFPFCSVPPLTPGSIKEQFPFPPGPKRARMAVYETSSPHSRPPLSSPVGSRVRGRDAFSRIPCPTMEPGQCHTTHSDPTSSPCAPFRCPTVGTSVTPLVPLVRSLGAWLELPRPSRWLLRTIRLGYAIQFARRPPKFRGIRFTSVLSKDAPVLRAEVAVLLAKDAIEPYLCLEAYGILSRYHAARIASYETASALASRPGPEMGMAPRHIPGLTHPVLPSHLQPLVGPCVSSGRSAPRASIQACCCFNRRLCHGLGGRVQRARSRGALDRAPAAVAYQLPRVAGSMACSAPLQNAATREACTGPLGQHCDRCVHQPPGRSTLPSHVATRPPSPPLESEASEVASRRSCPRRAQPCSRRALTSARPSGRMATPPRGTPADLETLRGRSGRPVCLPGHVSLPVVFLPVRGDPRYRCAGMQLASGLTQICVSPSEPSRTDPVQGQGGRGASPLGGALLAQPDGVSRTDAPRDSPSLANSSEEGSTFSERGHPLAPAPRLVESPRMVLGRDAEVLSGLPPAVVNTIASARALSTRQAYRLKWNLFVDWCSPRREDPRRCPIAVVLSFLQDGLEQRLSPSTLKVYVAAIAAHHDAVDGKSLGKHDLVIRFLRGARRLNPPRPHLVPSWDLPSVLSALRGAPFEPLQSVELKFLSLKTVLLSALATVKRVGDLQAFSVDDSCLEASGPQTSSLSASEDSRREELSPNKDSPTG